MYVHGMDTTIPIRRGRLHLNVTQRSVREIVVQKPPCRLFVITARDVPMAIVLRRGPTRWYHVIRWRMDTDTFEPGVWFHGRLYEERCDLSPDGELMVAFCHRGASRPGYTDSWAVVSRAPWLYALALWPWTGTWGGGGRFLDNRTVMLHSGNVPKTHPDHPATGLNVLPSPTLYGDYHKSGAEVEGADWSGRDHNGRLVFCRHGKVFRRGENACDNEIADFNDLVPKPTPAPEWAREPLQQN